ncbi:B12-binding domain-containing radical SAM protein [Nonomuraea angiospora]|uniref:Radical SAM core domain-containing protein n=1 Tax=Nonomuraea angiospora TaxID=46172 RepID=A0ABR9LNS7_9ACTN|nr:radical SAM protein [Nonomuraea angiospora]MBE1582301.1 hypothetical protein [Nonomuraea angiospora]
MDFLLSETGLTLLAERLERRAQKPSDRRARRGALLAPSAIGEIEKAKAVLRSFEGLEDAELYAAAQVTLRNAMWCVSAAFDGLRFDLTANDLYYSARSAASVLEATTDPERNVYRWAMDHLDLDDVIDDPGLGLVGVSVSADTQLVAAMTFARMVKQCRPDMHVVMGGNFTTRMVTRWEERHPFFDYVDSFILYEGEEALPALCEELFENGRRPVPGLVRAGRDGLTRTPPQDIDVSAVPFPDYSDSPLDKYFAPGPILPTYASRSCAWNCAFCAIPFASNKFRMRSGERVADEMDALSERYGTQYFYLVDEIITLRSFQEVGRELLTRGREYLWYGETRFFGGLDKEMAQGMHDAGCRRLSLGMESYNQRVLDLMGKGTQLEWIEPNLDALLSAGIPVHLFCIVGFPGETRDEAERTVAFATETCRRATSDYGVDHTTWAAAPFVLDLHSPIGRDPMRFGVVLMKPPPEEDLALTTNYRVLNGVSQEESWTIARRADNTEAVPDPGDTFWFDPPVRHYVEERLFLRTCLGLGPEQDPERPVRAWRGPDVPVALDDGVTCRWFDSSPMSGRPALVLYSPAADAVLEFPGLAESAANVLRRHSSVAEKAAGLAGDDEQRVLLLETLGAADRLGFFRGGSAAETELVACEFRQEIGVSGHFDLEGNTGRLRSEPLGRTVTVGARSYGAYLLCRDGCRATDSRTAKLGFDPENPLEFVETLRPLIAHGLVYATPA